MAVDKTYLIICNCGSCEHQAILNYWNDDEYPFVSMSFHLATWEGFLKRLWVGLKYAFGYKSRYGNFDEIIIDKKEANEIIKFFADIGYIQKS